MSTRRTRNPKFVSIGPKGAPGEIKKVKVKLFYSAPES